MDETLIETPGGGPHTETQQSVPRITVELIDPQLVRRVSMLCLKGLESVISWLPQSYLPKETLLGIMLSLKTEMTRLEEWTALLRRTVSTTDNEDPVLDQVESFNVVLCEVSVTLLLLAAQLEALVQKGEVKQAWDSSQLKDAYALIKSIFGQVDWSLKLSENLETHGHTPPFTDMVPASEIISDLIDCLWSYGSVMKMRATVDVMNNLREAESLSVGQVDQEVTINSEASVLSALINITLTPANESGEITQIIATPSSEVARAPIVGLLDDTPNVSPPSQTPVQVPDDLPPKKPRDPYELHDGPTDDGPGPTPGSVTWLTKRSKISRYDEPPSYAESEESSAYIKSVIVGDGACGKTCACRTFTHGVPRLEYIPTVFENYASSMTRGPEAVTLAMWDTAGQEDYDRLRPLSYPQTDVFIVSFAIDSPASLDNVQEKWISEVLHFAADQKSKILLAGLKADLRDDDSAKSYLSQNGEVPVSYERAMHTAKCIGASAYVECSAKTNEGISSLFQVAAELGWQKRRPLRVKKCSVM